VPVSVQPSLSHEGAGHPPVYKTLPPVPTFSFAALLIAAPRFTGEALVKLDTRWARLCFRAVAESRLLPSSCAS